MCVSMNCHSPSRVFAMADWTCCAHFNLTTKVSFSRRVSCCSFSLLLLLLFISIHNSHEAFTCISHMHTVLPLPPVVVPHECECECALDGELFLLQFRFCHSFFVGNKRRYWLCAFLFLLYCHRYDGVVTGSWRCCCCCCLLILWPGLSL